MRSHYLSLFLLCFLLTACELNSSPATIVVPTAKASRALPSAQSIVETARPSIPTPTAVIPATPEPEPTIIISNEATLLQDSIEREVKGFFSRYNFAKAPIGESFTLSKWAESSPEEQGMRSETLAELTAYIPEELDFVHSVVIARNGTLVYEYYKEGRSANSGELVWSITKSVTSMLIGIAIDDGLLTVDQTLGELLSADMLANSNPDLAAVTIHELLTMTSGIVCSNDRCHSDIAPSVLTTKLAYPPGAAFTYDTGATHLLSAVLQTVTGMPINEYAAIKLFTPLGISPPPWQIDAEGRPMGGKGIAMRPRDMAKLGQLLLDNGVWEGQRIISTEYIQTATQNHLGHITDEFQYGYLFWLNYAGNYKMSTAVGYSGQYIGIIPELNLTFAITSDTFPYNEDGRNIIAPFIVGAIDELP